MGGQSQSTPTLGRSWTRTAFHSGSLSGLPETGGSCNPSDLRGVEDLLLNGLDEIRRIQQQSHGLESSLSAIASELRQVRSRTEGLEDVFQRGLTEVRRVQEQR